MPTEIETDTDNTQPWTTIETASENGQAYKRTTTFDNGVVEVRNYGFFDGDLYRITTTDSPSENLYSWDTQVLNGNIVLGAFDIFEEIQFLDNGNEVQIDYANLYGTRTTELDRAELYDWTTFERFEYDSGWSTDRYYYPGTDFLIEYYDNFAYFYYSKLQQTFSEADPTIYRLDEVSVDPGLTTKEISFEDIYSRPIDQPEETPFLWERTFELNDGPYHVRIAKYHSGATLTEVLDTEGRFIESYETTATDAPTPLDVTYRGPENDSGARVILTIGESENAYAPNDEFNFTLTFQENGITRKVTQVGANDDFNSSTWLYDETGQVTERAALTHDGMLVLTTFEAGVIAQKTLLNLDGDYRWNAVVKTFDGTGALIDEVVYNDGDGMPEVDLTLAATVDPLIENYYQDFFAAELTVAPENSITVLTDDDGSKPWDRIEIEAEGGETIRTTTYLDDGTTRIDDLSGDQRLVTVIDSASDPSLNNWEKIERLYRDDGAVQSKTITQDDGLTYIWNYGTDSYLASLKTIFTEDDAAISREVFYVAGPSLAYDYIANYERNGNFNERFYSVDGGYTDIFYDNADLFEWTEIQTGYNATRTLTDRTTFTDAGVQIDETFGINGVLEERREYAPDDTTTVTEFNADGTKKKSVETLPDGVVTTSVYFDNGQLRYTSIDNRANSDRYDFETREDYYHANSADAGFLVDYGGGTNGRMEQRYFSEDGTPTGWVRYDFDPYGVEDWYQIVYNYDEGGEISRYEIGYDNSHAIDEIYEDGVIRKQTIIDFSESGDAFEFQRQVRLYDETGAITHRAALNDDGDGVIVEYEDGLLANRTLIDLNDDKPWNVINIDYAADGSLTARDVYFDGQDVPGDVHPDLGGFLNIEIA